MVVGHEVEHVLLKVGAGAGDGSDVPCTNHVRQTAPDFCRAHGTGECQEHFAALFEQLRQGRTRPLQCSSVEMTVVFVDKVTNTHGFTLP